jgi:hypothetical protein
MQTDTRLTKPKPSMQFSKSFLSFFISYAWGFKGKFLRKLMMLFMGPFAHFENFLYVLIFLGMAMCPAVLLG